jgi:hypothetical protein
MEKHLTSYQARKEEELKDLAAQLQQMQGASRDFLQASAQQLAGVADAAAGSLSSISDCSSAFCSQSTAALEQAQQAGLAAITAVQESLQVGVQQLQVLSAQHRAESEQAASWMQRTLQQLHTHMGAVSSGAAALLGESSQRHQGQLEVLDGLTARLEDSRASRQQELLEQVDALMKGFAEQEAKMMAEVVSTARSQLAAQHDAVASGIKQMSSGLEVARSTAKVRWVAGA